MAAAPVRDRVAAPFTGGDLARAIRWAKEWYIHQYRDSFQTAFAAFLLERAAWDFEQVDRGEVRRSVFTIGDVKRVVDATGSAKHHDTYKGVPADVATSTARFRHYYRLGRCWYEFTFLGPGPGQRYSGGATEPAGNYYLAVEYAPVPVARVPRDRRHHRPGHLLRHLREAGSAARAAAPFPTADFVGRKRDLAKLRREIVRMGDRVLVSIQGLPGVGKTEVVARLVDTLLPSYPDDELYVVASAAGKPKRSAELLREAIAALDPDAKLGADEAELAARYRALLRGRRALIVLENVLSAEDILPVLPPPGCAAIVTSRERLSLPGAPNPYVLAPLPDAEARHFVASSAPRVDVEADDALLRAARAAVPDQEHRALRTVADVLALLCGNLPLALRLCGRHLAQYPDLDAHAFARGFLDQRRRLELRGARAETLSIEASITISDEALSDTERAAFRALGVFSGSFSRLAAILVTNDPAPLEDDGAPTRVSELVQRGLVSYEPHHRRYRLHELLRAYAATRSDADRESAYGRLIDYYLFMAGEHQLWVTRRKAGQAVAAEPTFAEELANIVAVVSTLFDLLRSLDTLYAASDIVLGLGALLLRAAPEHLRHWSERLVAAFTPLAAEGRTHVQTMPTARVHVHAGPHWGSARIRAVHHAYYLGLAVEQCAIDGFGEDDAATHYVAVSTVREDSHLKDAATAEMIGYATSRLLRLARRSPDAPIDVCTWAAVYMLQSAERGPVDALLTDLVRVHALVALNDHKAAVSAITDLLASWRSRGDIPWAAAFYLDAIGEHPSVWHWALNVHTKRTQGGLLLTLPEHVLAVAANARRPENATLDDVTAHFRNRSDAANRAAYPIAAGSCLLALGRHREGLRLLADAIRIAEWVEDRAGLTDALFARAAANEHVGQYVRAREDLERVRDMGTAPGRVAPALARVTRTAAPDAPASGARPPHRSARRRK